MKQARFTLATMLVPLCTAAPVFAQPYPTKSIRIVVPFAPGGATDVVTRLVAPRLSEAVSQPVLVENRPGAGTLIATEHVMRSLPDGHTLLVCSASHTINPALYRKVNYDPIADFAPVSLAAAFSFMLVVHPSFPARTVKDYIALARTQPGKISFASSGVGSTNHLAGEVFRLMANINVTHVPYKGGGPASVDTVAGHIPSFFGNVIEVLPHVKGAKLRPLGVTSAARSSTVPDVPTIAEAALPGYDVTGWFAFLVPAATPKPAIAVLNREITRILGDTAIKERFAALGTDPWPTSPDEAQKFIAKETARWRKVIHQAGISAE